MGVVLRSGLGASTALPTRYLKSRPLGWGYVSILMVVLFVEVAPVDESNIQMTLVGDTPPLYPLGLPNLSALLGLGCCLMVLRSVNCIGLLGFLPSVGMR